MPLDITSIMLDGPPRVSFSGISSGIDTRAIVDAEVNFAQTQTRALMQQQALSTARQTVYGAVAIALQKLSSDAMQIDSVQDLLPAKAVVSDPTVLGAAAGMGAAPGTYSIVVNAIATAQSNTSGGYASPRRPGLLTPGTLSIQVGDGVAEVFQVDAGTTLLGFANTLNATSKDLTASVVQDGTMFKLQISAVNTGQANSVTFTDNGTGLDFSTQLSTAQDASVSINGADPITNANNTFTGAIPGVTLKTNAVSATPQNVTIALDTSNLASAITNLVGDYNAVQNAINGASAFTGTYDPESLIGDVTLHNLQGELQTALRPAATAAGSWVAPSQLGIATRADNTLRVDAQALQAAISLDPQSVAAMFSNTQSGDSLGVAGQLARVADSYGAPFAGILPRLNASITAENNRTQNIVQDMQYAVITLQQTLKNQFVAMEKQLSGLRAQNAIVAAYAYQVEATNDSLLPPQRGQLDALPDPRPNPVPRV
jgi:flagellar hook-associated protein 2